MKKDALNLRGMQKDESLKTVFDETTKEHTLVTTNEPSDKVLLFKFMTENNDGVTISANADYSDAGLDIHSC